MSAVRWILPSLTRLASSQISTPNSITSQTSTLEGRLFEGILRQSRRSTFPSTIIPKGKSKRTLSPTKIPLA
ncbi:hypothetical protein FOXYSP1_13207 [Fusarium oxysporum f. sp. phaseoli]